jgi:4'-phosphopantetheinyl transferase EntD
MTDPVDASLRIAMQALCVPGIAAGHRLISPGDEDALMPGEAEAFAASVVKVRRASGAARIVARGLLARLGYPDWVLPKSPSGAPTWPAEVVGSLAHDARVAVAAVGMRHHVAALGIDVEPAELLPADLLNVVATANERQQIAADPCGGRLLFAAKEAVYKAVHPLDRIFLEHHDVEVSLVDRKAVVRSNGRTVELRFCVSSHLVALAFISARPP